MDKCRRGDHLGVVDDEAGDIPLGKLQVSLQHSLEVREVTGDRKFV